MSEQVGGRDSCRGARWQVHLGWCLSVGAGVAAIAGIIYAVMVVRKEATTSQGMVLPASPKAYQRLPEAIRLHRLGLDVRGDGPDVTEVYTSGSVASDEDLACLSSWPHLRKVGLAGPGLSSAVVQNLHGLKQLTWLRLEVGLLDDKALSVLSGLTSLTSLTLGANVSDEELQYIAALTNLRVLELYYSKVTDAGVVHLLKLKSLRKLEIPQSEITDKGIAQLVKLDNLENLFLLGTKVTTDCLRYIPEFAKLKKLDVRDTVIRKADVEELHRTMPKLLIFVGDSMVRGDLEGAQATVEDE